jgi:hypothetical protein
VQRDWDERVIRRVCLRIMSERDELHAAELYAWSSTVQRWNPVHVQLDRDRRNEFDMPGDGAVWVRDYMPGTDLHAECSSL